MDAREMAGACGLPPRLSYTVAETAMYSGLSEWELRRAIAAGELPCVLRRGGMRGRRIRPEDLDAWMDALAGEVVA